MTHRDVQMLKITVRNDCQLLLSSSYAEGVPALRVLVGPGWPVGEESLSLAQLGSLVAHPQLRTLPIDMSHVVAFIPSVTGAAVLNVPAVALLQRLPLAGAPEIAAHAGTIAALHQLGLLSSAPDEDLPPPANYPVLSAWLHLSNACNLRCTYCYIQKGAEQMDAATARQAVDAVIRSAQQHHYREIALKYAGGEPLLALDTLELTHRYAQGRAAVAGLRLQAVVLTNGSALSERTLARLRALGIGVTVSLDSLDDPADDQRPTLSGHSSAARVRAGLVRAIAGGLTPTVAITTSPASVAGLPALAGWLLDHDLPFTVSFARTASCGSEPLVPAEEAAQLIAGMRDLYATIARRPPRWSVLGSLLDRSDLSHPHRHACAAGESYLVIDPRGRVAACQMTIGEQVSSVYAADPLQELRQAPNGLLRLPVDARPTCRACEWRYWCGGGCPVDSYRATGRYDAPTPNCAIYQALYPDLLRLEGQRLLYWAEADTRSDSFFSHQ